MDLPATLAKNLQNNNRKKIPRKKKAFLCPTFQLTLQQKIKNKDFPKTIFQLHLYQKSWVRLG